MKTKRNAAISLAEQYFAVAGAPEGLFVRVDAQKK